MMRVNLQKRCPFCDQRTTIPVFDKELERWYAGESARVVFADYGKHTCETIRSGICLKCQAVLETEAKQDDGIGFCPNCSTMIKDDMRVSTDTYFCTECGTSISARSITPYPTAVK